MTKLVDKPLTDMQKKFARYYVEAFYGKEDFKVKHNIDPDKHMARLNHIGQIAEQNKNYGVAIRAEELRGKVAGYYIDRQIINNKNDKSNMSEEELTTQLNKILHDYKHVLEDTEEADDGKKK